jgi:hypothetical protein
MDDDHRRSHDVMRGPLEGAHDTDNVRDIVRVSDRVPNHDHDPAHACDPDPVRDPDHDNANDPDPDPTLGPTLDGVRCVL